MERSCNIPAGVLLTLALGVACSAKPQCQRNTDVTCLAGSYYSTANCKCEQCPENTYSSLTGVRPLSCTRCKSCAGVFQPKVRCTPSQDAKCECIAGYRCIGDDCSMCTRNCEPGEEPWERGCRQCPHKTFNNQRNGFCKPWTNCLDIGLLVQLNGTSTTDTVCTHPPSNPSAQTIVTTVSIPGVEVKANPEEKATAYHVIIASVFCFVCLAVSTMAMVIWVKKKMKKGFKQIPAEIVKPAQEEDACSCRFPEEEQGDTVSQEP